MTRKMKIARINYRHLAALCAILALALAAFTGAHTAATVRAMAEPDLRSDLSSETQALQTYLNDLVAYNGQCAKLSKQASVRQADIDPLQRKSDDLKRRLPSTQGVIGAIIRKLKAANAWNDLDAKLLANTTDARVRTFFQESSFKQDLEDAAANLGSQANDIGIPIDNLRKKLTGQTSSPGRGASIVLVAYHPPAPMKFVSLACTIGRIQLRVIAVAGGVMSGATCDKVSCACNPSVGIGLCSSASCSTVN